MSTPRRRLNSAVAVGKLLLLALIPTIISDIISRRRPTKLHATSYLDGLRGLAALSVFSYHYSDYNHKFILPFYGHNDANNIHDGPSSLMQLPYVRLLYSGTPMVHIFFIISGFALSLRPLQQLYNPDSPSRGPSPDSIAKSQALLASSAFRRPIRLFIPPLFVTALSAIVVYVFGWMPSFMKPEPTLFGQITNWFSDAVNKIMWAWAWDDQSPVSRYNPHLWTIPLEFTHSMFLFLVLSILSRLRSPHTRQHFLAGLMVYCLLIGRWAAFEFLAGALLAELHLSTHFDVTNSTTRLPTTKCSKRLQIPSALRSTFQLVVLLAAGYLLSWPPRKADMVPSFEAIQSFTPGTYDGDKRKNFWMAIAAFGTVWSCGRIRLVKVVLTSPLPQYAGRISFCLYIFQHLVLNLLQHHVLGSEYKPATEKGPEVPAWGVRGTFGISSPSQRTLTWFAGLIILGGVLVILADLFTRILDGPAVRMSKRLEALAFASEETGQSTNEMGK